MTSAKDRPGSDTMIEIRIHGRGGQGGVTLAKLIATSRFLQGLSVQAFGLYAAERSGAPIQAFCRYSREPITNRNLIYEPDHVVVLDTTLIGPAIMDGLKPGGWICARTPGKYSYVALVARAVPNRLHGQVLARVQPGRKSVDVFPTVYKLNTRKAIAAVFPGKCYEDCTYYYAGEPAYHFGSAVMYQLLRFVAWVSPRPFYANLFVFLRKKS